MNLQTDSFQAYIAKLEEVKSQHYAELQAIEAEFKVDGVIEKQTLIDNVFPPTEDCDSGVRSEVFNSLMEKDPASLPNDDRMIVQQIKDAICVYHMEMDAIHAKVKADERACKEKYIALTRPLWKEYNAAQASAAATASSDLSLEASPTADATENSFSDLKVKKAEVYVDNKRVRENYTLNFIMMSASLRLVTVALFLNGNSIDHVKVEMEDINASCGDEPHKWLHAILQKPGMAKQLLQSLLLRLSSSETSVIPAASNAPPVCVYCEDVKIVQEISVSDFVTKEEFPAVDGNFLALQMASMTHLCLHVHTKTSPIIKIKYELF